MKKMRFFKERGVPAALTLGVFALNYLLDRFTKYLAVLHLKGRPPLRFLGDLVIITYAENSGAFLSLGARWNTAVKYSLLLIVPIIICTAGLLYLMIREQRLSRIVIFSCVAGGGMGNLVDRLFNGFMVIDFMNFGIGRLRTGILNVADLSVTFGVLVLIILETLPRRAGKATERPV
jgi:signal peptidase II